MRELDLAVPEGRISAFLGPNGSGKTTTIRLLLGLAHPTAGSGFVFGHTISADADSIEIRRRTGYVGEDKRLYAYMTVEQALNFTQLLYPTWNASREQELVKRFDLPLGRKCKKLSKGMRTKLALVLALARGADLLIFDEPSEGLDPEATEQLLEALVEAAADGVTVFFSTHQITDVERVADYVFIMRQGQLILESAMEDIRENHRRVHFAFPSRAPAEDEYRWRPKPAGARSHIVAFDKRSH